MPLVYLVVVKLGWSSSSSVELLETSQSLSHQIFLYPVVSFSSWIPIMYLLDNLILSHSSRVLCSITLTRFFSLYFSLGNFYFLTFEVHCFLFVFVLFLSALFNLLISKLSTALLLGFLFLAFSFQTYHFHLLAEIFLLLMHFITFSITTFNIVIIVLKFPA